MVTGFCGASTAYVGSWLGAGGENKIIEVNMLFVEMRPGRAGSIRRPDRFAAAVRRLNGTSSGSV
jgi:hypothetical protein